MVEVDSAATAGSFVTSCGGRLVFIGGDINTGWFESGLVARTTGETGEMGLDGSFPGVKLGVVLAVMGVLRVETEEVEWW